MREGNDLFVGLTGGGQLLVFDIAGWNLRYSLRKASNESTVWDVHKDFALMYDGKTIYCWDRHQHIEVTVDNDLQVGKHFTKEMEKDEYYLLKWNWEKEPEEDFPTTIRIFDEQQQYIDTPSCVIVRYASGLILKCLFETPYATYSESSNEHCIKKIIFHDAENRYDRLTNVIPYYEEVLFFPPFIGDSRDYPSYCPLIYHDGDALLLYELEYAEKYAQTGCILNVRSLYDLVAAPELDEDSDDEYYILLARDSSLIRKEQAMNRRMRKAILQNKEDDDVDYVYQKGDVKNSKIYFLEIWGRDRYNEPHHIRTSRIEGLVKATMNERVMVTVRQDSSIKSYFADLWDATDVVMDYM